MVVEKREALKFGGRCAARKNRLQKNEHEAHKCGRDEERCTLICYRRDLGRMLATIITQPSRRTGISQVPAYPGNIPLPKKPAWFSKCPDPHPAVLLVKYIVETNWQLKSVPRDELPRKLIPRHEAYFQANPKISSTRRCRMPFKYLPDWNDQSGRRSPTPRRISLD